MPGPNVLTPFVTGTVTTESATPEEAVRLDFGDGVSGVLAVPKEIDFAVVPTSKGKFWIKRVAHRAYIIEYIDENDSGNENMKNEQQFDDIDDKTVNILVKSFEELQNGKMQFVSDEQARRPLSNAPLKDARARAKSRFER